MNHYAVQVDGATMASGPGDTDHAEKMRATYQTINPEAEVTITYSRCSDNPYGPCPAHREETPDLDQCPHCDGLGAYWDDQTGQPDEPQGGRFVTCHVCRGEGTVDTSPCIACGAPKYDHDDGCVLA
jgi:DnaJ-class molecular chaperone